MLANCAIHDASSAGNLQAAILGSPSRCVFVSTAIVTREPFSSYAGSSMPEANAKLLSESADLWPRVAFLAAYRAPKVQDSSERSRDYSQLIVLSEDPVLDSLLSDPLECCL